MSGEKKEFDMINTKTHLNLYKKYEIVMLMFPGYIEMYYKMRKIIDCC